MFQLSQQCAIKMGTALAALTYDFSAIRLTRGFQLHPEAMIGYRFQYTPDDRRIR